MKDIYRREATAVGVGLLAAISLGACGVAANPSDSDPWMAHPRPTHTTYVDGTREMTFHSPERDRYGTEVVTDRCVNGQYVRHDPEIARLRAKHVLYFVNVLDTYPMTGPPSSVAITAMEACADDKLTPHDPVPALLLPK